jgi:septum site-determining protein MinD
MLAIAGGKGGCGKTTTSYRLAAALAGRGRAPLVADADHEMPDLHLLADVPNSDGLGAIASGADPKAVVQTPPPDPGVAVVPAGSVAGPDVVTALARLRAWDGPVLVDCPAGAARDAARPLRVADRTLLVTNSTAASLTDAAKTAAMARELDATPLGVVVVETTDPAHVGSSPVTERAARRLFDCSLFGHVPHVAAGSVADDRVRTAYRTVAKKILERNI